ncbi:MAG: RNA pseudouridine synthase [Eubacterium sp.]|nr:RNA pseudouridine synthase [Eubacterium sp.]
MSEQIIKLTPDSSDYGERLDKYISEELEEVSRSYVKKLIDGDCVKVLNSLKGNLQKKLKASYILSEGDSLEITMPEPEKLTIEAENIPLDIVYEDEDLIIINKPQGMVVHPAPGNYSGTLVNALMYHCGDSLSSINGVERPGIVHRIDKDTSGLLLVCKTNLAHQSLAIQFAEHTINRVYSAIVYNHFDISKMELADDDILSIIMNKEEREIVPKVYTQMVSKPIARAKNDRKKMAIDPDGRRAVTHIYLQNNLKDNMAYVKCKLETGRTHQIRVHLTSINHPLLGDPVYGPKTCPYNLSGQVLHAGTLGFIHPRSGEYMEFRGQLPEYFTKLISRLK